MVFFRPERPGYGEDPYGELARLRAAEPVHWSVNLGAWVVTSYSACERVLLDTEAFSADPGAEGGAPGERVMAHRRAMPLGEIPILGHVDGPEHARLRGAVSKAFGARAVARREGAVRALVEELLARAGPGERLDLMEAVARPLAVMTAMRHLGLPPGRWEAFHGAALAVMQARVDGLDADPAGAAGRARGAAEFILECLADAEEGEETVAGALAGAVDGGAVAAGEAVMLLVHIALAGNIPTAMAFGTAAWALARHPEWLERLAEGTVGAGEVVEEALRWDSPTHAVPRFATMDSELEGRRIRRGQRVLVMIGAANRDPARFSEPNRFEPGREGARHLSFGVGPHYCLGAPLARAELAIAVETLVRRLGRFRVVEARRGGTLLVRGFERLVVVAGSAGELEG